MDNKNGKQYLPQTYEQFQQQKKKTAKQNNFMAKSSLPADYSVSGSKQLPPKEHKNRRAIYDSDEEIVECEIGEKIIYSDYQIMFDNFEKNKFG